MTTPTTSGLAVTGSRLQAASGSGTPGPESTASSSSHSLIKLNAMINGHVPPSPRPPSLEYLESNAHRDRAPASWKSWRHCRDQDRDRIRDVLVQIQSSEQTMKRFEGCGGAPWIEKHKDNHLLLRVKCDKCRNRHCPACAREKAFIIQHNLTILATTAGHRLSMVTFTLKHSDTPLREQIKRLVVAFRDLRRLKIWRENVRAAAWVIECKVGDDGRWHPHIHVLAETFFMAQHSLSTAWLACTGDSRIVDVRRISATNGARYVAKYAGKPAQTAALTNSQLQEYMIAFRGVRTCATLGKWRACPLAQMPDDEELLSSQYSNAPGSWVSLGSYEQIRERAYEGDAYCVETLRLLGFPLFEEARFNQSGKESGP